MGNLVPLSREDGQRLCEEINGLKYFECSARTGVGLEELFVEAARTVILLRYPKISSRGWRLPRFWRGQR